MKTLSLAIISFLGYGCGGTSQPSMSQATTAPVVTTSINPNILAALAGEPDLNARIELEEFREKCSSPNIKSIEGVAIHHGDPQSTKITYYFEHVIRDVADVTVIFLPGGPGGDGIGNHFHAHEHNYINISPRGMGCNYGSESVFDAASLTTLNTALNLVEVIRHLDLQNYVIYGTSYGTMLGTILTHSLEAAGIPGPKSLVLEGTLGRGIANYAEYSTGFSAQWERLKSEEPNIAALFAGEIPLLGIAAEYWAPYLFGTANDYEGVAAALRKLADAIAAPVPTPEQKEVMDWFKGVVRYGFGSLTSNRPAGDRVMFEILCKDITPSWRRAWPELHAGKLLLPVDDATVDQCRGITFDQSYDSATYPVEVPIYYLQGEADPATPLASALYHYQHQIRSPKRHFQRVVNGGHGPSFDVLEPCMTKVWDRIFALNDLNQVVTSDGRCR